MITASVESRQALTKNVPIIYVDWNDNMLNLIPLAAVFLTIYREIWDKYEEEFVMEWRQTRQEFMEALTKSFRYGRDPRLTFSDDIIPTMRKYSYEETNALKDIEDFIDAQLSFQMSSQHRDAVIANADSRAWQIVEQGFQKYRDIFNEHMFPHLPLKSRIKLNGIISTYEKKMRQAPISRDRKCQAFFNNEASGTNVLWINALWGRLDILVQFPDGLRRVVWT